MCSENSYEGVDEVTVRIVREKAREIVQSGKLGVFEQEDVEQELMIAALDALAKVRHLQTASASTYVYSAVRKAAASIFQHVCTQRRGWGRFVAPITETDAACDDEDCTPMTSGEDSGAASRLDLRAAMRKLTRCERKICTLLMQYPLAYTAVLLGVTRQALYLRRQQIAKKLRISGISA